MSASNSVTICNKDYRKITKTSCKILWKELQYDYRKRKALLDCEIFFFLFLRYRVSSILLRLFSFTAVAHTAQAVSRFVCKKARPENGRAFLRPFLPVKKMKIKPTHRKSVDKVLLCPNFLYKLTVFPWSIFTKFVLYSPGICGII